MKIFLLRLFGHSLLLFCLFLSSAARADVVVSGLEKPIDISGRWKFHTGAESEPGKGSTFIARFPEAGEHRATFSDYRSNSCHSFAV